MDPGPMKNVRYRRIAGEEWQEEINADGQESLPLLLKVYERFIAVISSLAAQSLAQQRQEPVQVRAGLWYAEVLPAAHCPHHPTHHRR